MSHEDPGNISFSEVGGLSEQIRELREVKKNLMRLKIYRLYNKGRGITVDKSRIVSTCGYYTTKRLSSFWTTR